MPLGHRDTRPVGLNAASGGLARGLLVLWSCVAASGCILTRERPEPWPDAEPRIEQPPAPKDAGSHSTNAASPARADAPPLFKPVAELRSREPREPKERLRCPDELLPRGDSQAELSIELVDARSEARELLPVDFRESVSRHAPEGKPRYVAQLRVEDYAAPKLFRRLNAPRSEWAAGRLSAWLVISDAEKGETVCRAPIHVKGDASNAKVSRRLRESTRAELERRLYQRVNSAMDQALAGISAVFRRKSAAS